VYQSLPVTSSHLDELLLRDEMFLPAALGAPRVVSGSSRRPRSTCFAGQSSRPGQTRSPGRRGDGSCLIFFTSSTRLNISSQVRFDRRWRNHLPTSRGRCLAGRGLWRAAPAAGVLGGRRLGEVAASGCLAAGVSGGSQQRCLGSRCLVDDIATGVLGRRCLWGGRRCGRCLGAGALRGRYCYGGCLLN